MTYLFNNTVIVTIYTYIVYPLYIKTLLYLLRGKYIGFLYCVGYLLKDIGYLFLATQPQFSLFSNSNQPIPTIQYQFSNRKGGE